MNGGSPPGGPPAGQGDGGGHSAHKGKHDSGQHKERKQHKEPQADHAGNQQAQAANRAGRADLSSPQAGQGPAGKGQGSDQRAPTNPNEQGSQKNVVGGQTKEQRGPSANRGGRGDAQNVKSPQRTKAVGAHGIADNNPNTSPTAAEQEAHKESQVAGAKDGRAQPPNRAGRPDLQGQANQVQQSKDRLQKAEQSVATGWKSMLWGANKQQLYEGDRTASGQTTVTNLQTGMTDQSIEFEDGTVVERQPTRRGHRHSNSQKSSSQEAQKTSQAPENNPDEKNSDSHDSTQDRSPTAVERGSLRGALQQQISQFPDNKLKDIDQLPLPPDQQIEALSKAPHDGPFVTGPFKVPTNVAGIKMDRTEGPFFMWAQDGHVTGWMPAADVPPGASQRGNWWIYSDGVQIQAGTRYPENTETVKLQMQSTRDKQLDIEPDAHDVQRRVDAGKELNSDIDAFLKKGYSLEGARQETLHVHQEVLRELVTGAFRAYQGPTILEGMKPDIQSVGDYFGRRLGSGRSATIPNSLISQGLESSRQTGSETNIGPGATLDHVAPPPSAREAATTSQPRGASQVSEQPTSPQRTSPEGRREPSAGQAKDTAAPPPNRAGRSDLTGNASAAHAGGAMGEQDAGFVIGKKGFEVITGPSGQRGHGLTQRGIDMVAFNPRTNQLWIVDNKASGGAGEIIM